MEHRIKQFLIFLLLLALLAFPGCSEKPAVETTVSTEPSIPITQPADPLEMLADARDAVSQAAAVALDIQLLETRTMGEEIFRRSSSIDAVYSGLGTRSLEALVEETLSLGSYTAQYTQSYIGGKAYAMADNVSFVSELTPEEFLACQIPALLFDPGLYAAPDVSGEEGAGYTYSFTDATGFESWLELPADAVLTAAEGSARLDASGMLEENGYILSYTIGDTACTLEITVALSYPSQPDITARQPEYPEDCVPLTSYTAPRLLLQATGSISAIQDMSCIQTETIYCEAAALVRTQQLKLDVCGSGKDFMAQADYTVSLTDYTNTATTNTQVETFRDGKYQYSINGADPVTQDGITQAQMRAYCEESILALVLSTENIAGIEIVDTGDFYCLQMTCVDSASDAIFDSIFQLLNLDLDIMSESFTTDTGTAYLTVSKLTGLPTAMGYRFSRSHVIDSVTYRTTYQVDQSLSMPSRTAYSAITGETAPETKPEETATPLFYKVSDSKGRTLWLLGTIHVGDARTAYLPQAVYDAFAGADALAVEFDTDAFQQQVLTDPALQQQVSSAYYYSDGSTIASHLDPELYKQAYALILASGNNSMNALYMKPAFWESLLQNYFLACDGELTAQQGMDSRLLALARQQEKTILEIETGISQLQMLSDFSDALQEMLLAETASASILDYCESVCQLYDAWCRGDADELTQLVLEETSGMTAEELVLYNEYNKAISTDRNAVMLKAAKKYLRSGDTVFYAVGVAHLLGETGLVAQLQNAGYTVEQVTY